jgi:hypothetical protein
MLRLIVIGFGGALVLGGLMLLHCGAGGGAVMPMLFGALVIGGTIFERGRYRQGGRGKPAGPEWEATGEKFRDPGSSGQLVEVWYNKVTGERRYVQI